MRTRIQSLNLPKAEKENEEDQKSCPAQTTEKKYYKADFKKYGGSSSYLW
jgi:hypothetical protein